VTPLDDETARLVRGFEDGSLTDFPHEAHVRVGWAYARTLPLLDAIARMSEGLRRFAASRGVPGKYHATITWAFVFLIHERVARGDDDADGGWAAFARANGDLFERALLLRYYAEETLDSALARRVFVLPDAPLHAARTEPVPRAG
jgi:hypothetical protein